MAQDEHGDKTEQPTDRKLTQAREQGNVARSTDLNAAGLMLAATLAMWMLGIPTFTKLGQLMQSTLRGPARLTLDGGTVLVRIQDLASLLGELVLPLMLLMMASALFLNFVQVGFLVAPEALEPKLQRINPIEGAKRLLSTQALVKLATSLGKLLVMVAIAVWTVSEFLPRFLPLYQAEAAQILLLIQQAIVQLALLLALALVLLAALDFVFQKWKHTQGLMMTKQEVRDEMKNMEGDPQIRARRREVHRKLAQARELQQVQQADVVITNPTHISVAIKYDPEVMPAPTVVAKGMGEIALRIRQIAAEHGIPMIERKPLARSLYDTVKTGQQIPVEMYEVFVEIMAYVYRITGHTPTNLD